MDIVFKLWDSTDLCFGMAFASGILLISVIFSVQWVYVVNKLPSFSHKY